MEAAAPLQHIPGEHNGNAILPSCETGTSYDLAEGCGHSCRSERDAPRAPFSARGGNEDGGDSLNAPLPW